MKKNIIATIILLALCISCLFSLQITAAPPTPRLSIDFVNLSYSDAVYIKYAVAAENVTPDDVRLLVWREADANGYAYGTQDEIILPSYLDTIGGEEYIIFDYKNLAAKEMGDDVYVRAAVEADGVWHTSAAIKYSVLRYAYDTIHDDTTAETLQNMMGKMLEYGASAQLHFDYKPTRLVSDNFYQIAVTAGSLHDGFTYGLYHAGDTITLMAPTTDPNGTPFSHWEDKSGKQISTASSYTLTVGTADETYTPVYKKYSQGLEFDADTDGTCYVVGMGDCTDTDVIIPAVSPDGDTVVGIDSSAFAGEPITSIHLPGTIVDIGRRAFNNCTNLADVYFDGTEEDWNEINISTGNDPLETATLHFREPAVVTFTVTFKDHDGTVLKTEPVESGKSATAPADPVRDGYTFTGWDKAFDNVTSDLVVTATYLQVTEPTVIISNATDSTGEQVEVTVNMVNSPALYAMSLKLAFDESALELVKAEDGKAMGTAMNGFSYTPPSNLKNGCNFMWYANDPATANGTILKLTFKIKAAAGTHAITMTCDPTNTLDANEQSVTLDFANGSITVAN